MAGATKAPRTSGNDEAQAFDAILRKLEGSLSKADAQQNAAVASVKFQGIVVDLFAQLEAARSLMMTVLQSENVKRTVLQHVFGGDCVRISRARAVVETALQMDYGTGRNQMAEECLRACESVEQVLGDLGLGFSLRKAQVQERELLQRRRHGVAVAVPSKARPEAATTEMEEVAESLRPSLETSPTEPSPAEPSPTEPSLTEPSPGEPSSAEPSPAEPSPAEPSPAEPSPAEPSPVEPSPVELSESSPAEQIPSEQNSAEPSTAEPSPPEPSTEPSPVEASPVEASSVEASSVEEEPPEAEDELQLCSVEPRSLECQVDEVTGYPAEKGSAEARQSKSSKTSADSLRRDEKTEPEAEPLLAPSRRSSGSRSEDTRSEGLQPIRFAPHLAALVGRVFLHYASGDCTAPGMGGLSSTRFRCFLRDCSILSSDPGETLQRGPSSSDVAIDRRSPAGLVVSPSRSQGPQGPRKMSRQLSGSFTAGFGTTAEAAAAESGKLPLTLCAAPVLTRAQADLLYIQAMKQQEVHMTQESFVRALAIVGQQCLSGVHDVYVPRDDASVLNWFCQWALVPLAEALGISQHDVLCAAEILRDPEVSALLRSCQRGLHIVFARYAMASPAPREPYRKGFWTVQSMQRFAAEAEISAELSHQCLQRIFTGCVQHECSLERKTLPGKMSSSCFLLALIVIAQRVHSTPGCTPLMRVAMFMLRLSICRGASDLGVAARRVLGKAKR